MNKKLAVISKQLQYAAESKPNRWRERHARDSMKKYENNFRDRYM